MTINQKLATIQTEFKSKKSRFNSFGKYYFRSAEDILEAIKPFLLKYGVTVTVNEKLIVSEPTPVIKTTATIHDEKGMRISTSAIVGVDLMQKGMQTPQQFGSASSYGKKYALGNLFLIDDTADSDAVNDHSTVLPDVQKAKDYIKSGGTLDQIKKKYKVTKDQEKELTTL
ncbi:MAG: single-stranded DNA-binding protein [Rhodopirellula sp.]|jgi:hypothetical protein|nr:single-stranded DNA-binding protein [Rhodopirellula sp.]|tara:strand:+ start:170 stop:682 length:513 start_codon:yes stop_codon:yes gene_type:complete